MRGATKCIKHGGRVQVPEHLHNIRRFLSGAMFKAAQQQEAYLLGREVWKALTLQERRCFLATLPEHVIENPRKLYLSVSLTKGAEGTGYVATSRVLAGVRSGELL